MEEADLVLLLCDARDGLTPIDEQVARELRTMNKPTLLVVNKIDGLNIDLVLPEFFALGHGEPIPIAAAHGRGVLQMIDAVLKETAAQLEALPRKEFAAKALENSKAILLPTAAEMIELVNEYAAEHLIISCKDDEAIAEQIINAGSIFLGNYSPESVGDYASGTNHTLPTNGYAKAYSGVSVDSFVKKITFQKLSKEGLQQIGKAVELMAEAEGLQAHAEAVRKRSL